MSDSSVRREFRGGFAEGHRVQWSGLGESDRAGTVVVIDGEIGDSLVPIRSDDGGDLLTLHYSRLSFVDGDDQPPSVQAQGISVRDIPEEMVELAVAHWYGHPDEIEPEDEESCADSMRALLSAALAGRTVVKLPTPDRGVLCPSGRTVVAKVDAEGRPFVRVDGQIWLVGEAEDVGLALIAASRDARRLAAESVSQKGGDTNGA